MKPYNIEDLEIFAAIARHRSFRAAATERGVSPSALSQAMRALEERLGMRLLNRTTRSVALTEAGDQLLRRLQPALDDISQAVDEINTFRARPAGTVRINAPGPAVDHVLMPLVEPFLKAHPDISIEIIGDPAITDIVAQGFDAGVRFGEELARDMIAVPLGPPLRYAVVASPAYLHERAQPRVPKDILTHSCIRHRFPGGSIFAWEFSKGNKTVTIVPGARVTLNGARPAVQAALAGLGLARVLEEYISDHVARGELVEVLHDWSPRLPSWYLYYPSPRHLPAAMQAFLRFLSHYKQQVSSGTALP